MSNYRFKRQYSPSTKIIAFFRMAFVIAVIGFVFEFVALFLPSESSLTFHAGPGATLLFFVVFCVVLALLCANAALWFGMLHFLVTYDGRGGGKKAFWAVITFFGLSVGAAVYYWFVYRKYVASTPSGQPHAQPA